jgi:hypothetical protein
MSRQIVVPGMHRSGTSMVAGVLQRLGVFMGEHLLGADISNPSGHYEDLEFQQINKAILRAAGGSWRHPPSHDAIMAVHAYDRHMEGLVAKRDREHELWGWKDPRTCLTLCKWAPLLSQPMFVFVDRNPEAIQQSLMRRNGMSAEEADELDAIYCDRTMDVLALYEDAEILVPYEQVLMRPKLWVALIAGELGLSPTSEAIAFIDPSLDHSRVPTCA